MQVTDKQPISDYESMRRGAKIVCQLLQNLPIETQQPKQELEWLAQHYNGSKNYTKYLNTTYPGLRLAWKKIENDSN